MSRMSSDCVRQMRDRESWLTSVVSGEAEGERELVSLLGTAALVRGAVQAIPVSEAAEAASRERCAAGGEPRPRGERPGAVRRTDRGAPDADEADRGGIYLRWRADRLLFQRGRPRRFPGAGEGPGGVAADADPASSGGGAGCGEAD